MNDNWEITGEDLRCETVADDGARCVAQSHEDDPDAHDFTEQGPAHESADGGAHWSTWIVRVNRIRDLLLDQRYEDGPHKGARYGLFDQEAYAHEKLAEIARIAGLEVGIRGDGTPEIIRG